MDPTVIKDAVEQISIQQGNNMPAGYTESIADMVQSMMPFMVLLITFLKCALIGILAALIISRSIPGRTRNPFENRM